MANFREIREAIPIDEVARGYLGLKLEGDEHGALRGHCPRCQPEKEGRGVLVIKATEKRPNIRYFSCHKSKDWGDCISLVAHCHNISMHEAGEQLAKVYLEEVEAAATSEQEAAMPKPSNRFDPVRYARSLHQRQEDVSEFGILAELCEEAGGMGLATKGINRGKLAVPLRREDGTLITYIGVSGDVSVPKQWRVA